MDNSKNLEIQGSLATNSLAELLCEIRENRFTGALRLASDKEKIVVYFDAGNPIFAVSNARQHRLFQTLLQAERINRDALLGVKDFTNDLILKDYLLTNNLLKEFELDEFFKRQISGILETALEWKTGEWIFSSLVRVKNELRYAIDADKLAFDHARGLTVETAARRLNSSGESFSAISPMPAGIELSPHEWFVHSRFENAALGSDAIQNLSGLPAGETVKILYALWLGGFLKRHDFHRAFSERYAAAAASARLALKKDEENSTTESAAAPVVEPLPITKEETEPSEDAAAEQSLTLEEYLARVEKAANFYESFGLLPDADASEIKRSYFGLAKRFHPDLFRKETDIDRRRRIENAFSKLAQGYDTLKDESSREVYDFKMRKEIGEMLEHHKKGETDEQVQKAKQTDEAGENFEQGFSYLMEEDYETAVPFLARAVFYGKDNARYHAYYGKALSANENQRHRAEAEMQTAVRLDGNNPDYRLMLAEFFVEMEFLKRAEGELNRLLAITPNHQEARRMLDSLKRK